MKRHMPTAILIVRILLSIPLYLVIFLLSETIRFYEWLEKLLARRRR